MRRRRSYASIKRSLRLARNMPVWALSIISLLCAPDRLLAASEPRQQIGFVSFVPGVAPLWVAADGQFFAQEGVKSELIFIGTAPTMVASMTAREVPLAVTAGTAVLSAIAAGAPIKILATFNNWLTADFVARPGILRPEHLRDKRVGVQSIGGGIWMQALLTLEHLGVDPAKDRIHIQVIGPQAQLAKALEVGAIDATVLPSAFSRPLKARGFPILAELRSGDIPLTVNSLIALKETIDQFPHTVEQVLKALVRAIAFIYEPHNRRAVTRILARRLQVDGKAAEEAYVEALESLERKPYPSAKGLLNIQRMLARSNPKAGTIRVEDVIDVRILHRLDQSGFLDAVYGVGAR
jgi:ABC-type nitrate/sulfonate/bicarbonate transport system substrate-binding protein